MCKKYLLLVHCDKWGIEEGRQKRSKFIHSISNVLVKANKWQGSVGKGKKSEEGCLECWKCERCRKRSRRYQRANIASPSLLSHPTILSTKYTHTYSCKYLRTDQPIVFFPLKETFRKSVYPTAMIGNL